MKKEIYGVGMNDTYVEQILIDSAERWIEENTDIPEEDKDEAVEIYKDGFIGK